MNTEKKERIIKKQKFLAILARNRKINKINIFILGAGLLFMLIGQNVVGNIIIWPGVAIFIYTLLSNTIARRA